MARVPVDERKVAECRALASEIADDVQKYIDRHTSVGAERTILRAFGVDGVDDQGAPIVNLAVETAVVSGCALVRLGRPSGQGLLAAALAQAHAGGVVLSRGAIREVDRTLAVLPDDLPEPPDWDIPHMIDVATKG